MANTTLSIKDLRSKFRGQVIAPGDPDYDGARAVFYSWYDKHPAVIIRPVDAAEVVRVVTLARETGLELAVRSGGHNNAGYGVSEGGIVLDLSNMKALDIDVASRTAWVETGVTAGGFTNAAAEHGLAVGFGDTGTVGIGGLTLGGGVGYLVRKYGLTIDSLLAAEVVTANGQILQVDANTHPDLFWAIRGGGGNFGVATRFQFKLNPVDDIYGGMLILPATAETISGFMRAAEAAPDELSAIANVMPAPPMPFLPEELHGTLVIFAMVVYSGDPAKGESAVAPFRKLATPLADMLKPMRYKEIFEGEEGPHPAGAAVRSMFMDEFDNRSAQAILDHLDRSNAPIRVAQLRPLGGAMARVPALATAFAHRKRKIMVNVAAVYDNADEGPKHEAWVAGFADALRKAEDGVYVNFLAAEGQPRVREAYPGLTWDALAKIKLSYDPDNLFKLNQNILPATE